MMSTESIETYNGHRSGSHPKMATTRYPQQRTADQTTIQAGIDAASDGDTVLVAAGTYIENINYNGKNIAVIGEDRETTIIDGGQNHLKATKKSLESLDFTNMQVIAISKGVRRKADKDSIHLNEGSSLSINKSSIEDLLIQEMRDEAHRFSITNQRKKMSKQAYRSSLDLIPGIGKKRKKVLIRYFGSVDQILKAGIHDLVKVEGIGKETAVSIYDYLR